MATVTFFLLQYYSLLSSFLLVAEECEGQSAHKARTSQTGGGVEPQALGALNELLELILPNELCDGSCVRAGYTAEVHDCRERARRAQIARGCGLRGAEHHPPHILRDIEEAVHSASSQSSSWKNERPTDQKFQRACQESH